MNYEDYVTEKLMLLEKFVLEAKNQEDDLIKQGKFLLEAYHLARLRGYGAEIASVGYYISTSIEVRNERTFFFPERIDMRLIVKYLKEFNADQIIKDFFFNKKKEKVERRSAGFTSEL